MGSSLLDGLADRDRVRLVTIEGGKIRAISVEDLIADRMGQFDSGAASLMRDQARALFDLYDDVDLGYLERRIREETDFHYGVEDIRQVPRDSLD